MEERREIVVEEAVYNAATAFDELVDEDGYLRAGRQRENDRAVARDQRIPQGTGIFGGGCAGHVGHAVETRR